LILSSIAFVEACGSSMGDEAGMGNTAGSQQYAGNNV
jgi:hypothetical protein